MSYQFKTEHYEAVLKAGDMERCLPDARLAPRGSPRRPELPELLRGATGEQVRQGRARRVRRRRAVRRLPVALLPSSRQRRLRPLRREVLPLLAPAAPEPAHAGAVRARRVARGQRRAHDRHLPGCLFPTPSPPQSPEDYVNHSLYLEAKTFLHGLLVVEDKLSMAHSLETRVPFLDNDLVDFAQRLPVRLKLSDLERRRRARRERAGAQDRALLPDRRATASCCCGGSCRALRSGVDHRPGQAGLLGTGLQLVPRRQPQLCPRPPV